MTYRINRSFESDKIRQAASKGLLPDWILRNRIASTGENPLDSANEAERYLKTTQSIVLWIKLIGLLGIIVLFYFTLNAVTGSFTSHSQGFSVPLLVPLLVVAISIFGTFIVTSSDFIHPDLKRIEFANKRGEFGFDLKELLRGCGIDIIDLREFTKEEIRSKYHHTLIRAVREFVKSEVEFLRETGLTLNERKSRVLEFEKIVGESSATKLKADFAKKFLIAVRFGLASHENGWTPYFDEAKKELDEEKEMMLKDAITDSLQENQLEQD